MSRAIAIFSFVTLGVGASAIPAKANIRCDDEFQTINGARVATPYCEAEQLARLSRGRGVNISGEAIRKTPRLAEDLCRGTNLSSACGPFQD